MYKHYCYSLEDHLSSIVSETVKKDQIVKVKIGETTQETIVARIKQQAATAVQSSPRLFNIDLPAVKEQDKVFHKFLQSKGFAKSKDIEHINDVFEIEGTLVVEGSQGTEWFDIPFRKLKDYGFIYTNISGDADAKKIQVHRLIKAITAWHRDMFNKWQKTAQTPDTFDAGASNLQLDTMERLITKYAQGNNIQLLGAAPRAQKTKMALFLAKVIEADVTIVNSYVLSVFNSFLQDAKSFNQTKDYFTFVDPRKDEDWKETVNSCITNKKKVIILMSLCGSSSEKDFKKVNEEIGEEILTQTDDRRKECMSFIKSLNVNKFWIVDEGDYGAHCKNQWKALAEGRRDSDPMLIMTGTNPERAVSNWNVDNYVEILYTEMIQEKMSVVY